MSLSRPQFKAACTAYLANHSSTSIDCHDNHRHASHWDWIEHRSFPGHGYLVRTVSFPYVPQHEEHPEEDDDRVEESTEPPDDATLSTTTPCGTLTCNQYVVYSPTFQVPAFYFSMHHSTGVPLSLREVTCSPLFRPDMLPDTQTAGFAVTLQDSAFALLSQGNHPILGTPCWYLHPCHTAEVVEELVKEMECDETERPLRWIEAWFMMMSNLVVFEQRRVQSVERS